MFVRTAYPKTKCLSDNPTSRTSEIFVADSMRFFRAPTTSIDSVNSAQMIDMIEVLIVMMMKKDDNEDADNEDDNDGDNVDDGVDDTSPEVWLELFCETLFRAEIGPRRYLNGAPVFSKSHHHHHHHHHYLHHRILT